MISPPLLLVRFLSLRRWRSRSCRRHSQSGLLPYLLMSSCPSNILEFPMQAWEMQGCCPGLSRKKSAPKLGTDYIRPQPPCFSFETSTKRQRTDIRGSDNGEQPWKPTCPVKRSASLLGDDLQNRPDAAFHRHSSL